MGEIHYSRLGKIGYREFYTVRELAEILDYSPSTIYRWMKRGENEIPCHTIAGRKRFRCQDIESFVQNLLDMR